MAVGGCARLTPDPVWALVAGCEKRMMHIAILLTFFVQQAIYPSYQILPLSSASLADVVRRRGKQRRGEGLVLLEELSTKALLQEHIPTIICGVT